MYYILRRANIVKSLFLQCLIDHPSILKVIAVICVLAEFSIMVMRIYYNDVKWHISAFIFSFLFVIFLCSRRDKRNGGDNRNNDKDDPSGPNDLAPTGDAVDRWLQRESTKTK